MVRQAVDVPLLRLHLPGRPAQNVTPAGRAETQSVQRAEPVTSRAASERAAFAQIAKRRPTAIAPERRVPKGALQERGVLAHHWHMRSETGGDVERAMATPRQRSSSSMH